MFQILLSLLIGPSFAFDSYLEDVQGAIPVTYYESWCEDNKVIRENSVGSWLSGEKPQFIVAHDCTLTKSKCVIDYRMNFTSKEEIVFAYCDKK